MAPDFGHGSLGLPGVQILSKANVSEQGSALTARKAQGSD